MLLLGNNLPTQVDVPLSWLSVKC